MRQHLNHAARLACRASRAQPVRYLSCLGAPEGRIADETGKGFADAEIGFFAKVGKKNLVRMKEIACAIHDGYRILYQFNQDVDGFFVRKRYRHGPRRLLVGYKAKLLCNK
ncbi:hypothetical protein [Chlorobaculum thiosulfatiphilum]|uniref:hypothetical protein n=1 Tax=Chlorobaculum thiosulfatiphilum TaxID=115852 RepID=UPI00147717F2|nr:hypothetical protein [Chlorobaculum thiosulfatiphilum]